MSDADTYALIEQLQKSNRLWKRLALGLLAVLGLTVLLSITSATVLSVRIERERERALAAEEQAHKQSQEARNVFEHLRKGLDEFQQKARQP
jgi:hypothetical protein